MGKKDKLTSQLADVQAQIAAEEAAELREKADRAKTVDFAKSFLGTLAIPIGMLGIAGGGLWVMDNLGLMQYLNTDCCWMVGAVVVACVLIANRKRLRGGVNAAIPSEYAEPRMTRFNNKRE